MKHKQINDDVIMLLKEEIEYLKVEAHGKKIRQFRTLSDFDNSSPWLPVETSHQNIYFTLDTPPKVLKHMLKKRGPAKER